MNRINYILLILLAWTLAGEIGAQSGTPEPTPTPRIDQIEEQKRLIEKETDLLRTRRLYLEELKSASGGSTVTRDTSGGKTAFDTEDKVVFETVTLSYEALAELASAIDGRLKPHMSGYDRIVLYYEPDFLALSRYRLYREQARQALENYAVFKKAIEDLRNEKPVKAEAADRGAGVLGIGLGLPSFAGTTVRSVAELIALFRTDRTITSQRNLVDPKALNPILAGAILRNDQRISVYNPEQFVSEYDFGIGDEQSFYETLGRLQMADVYLDLFLTKYKQERSSADDPLAVLIMSAKIVKAQIGALTFAIAPDPIPVKPEERAELTEFRNMVRAEKLDRYLRAGVAKRTGILIVRLLTSGGSRRESRNLLLGTRNDYSGSAVAEVALYDTDGTLRVSDVMTYHTGFRKFRSNSRPEQ